MVAHLRRSWPLALGVMAAGILAYLEFRPSAPMAFPRTNGPDFRLSSQNPCEPLRIVVYGDMRFTDPEETKATNPKARRWLVEKIATERPDAVLLSGDVPWKGGRANDYAVFHSETEIWRADHLQVYPALGNHEFSGADDQQCLRNWWNAFPEFRGRRVYSVQLSDTVYLLSLDSNSSLMPGSDQIAWVRSQLANLPSTVRFVIFNLHHPPVVDFQPGGDPGHNGRPNERALADFLDSAPEKGRVRFVVTSGHIHNYERFFQNGVVYLVCGGGGAKPRPIQRRAEDLYQDSAFPNYSYVRIVEDGDALDVAMIRLADPEASTARWQEKDRFQITAKTQAATSAAGRPSLALEVRDRLRSVL